MTRSVSAPDGETLVRPVTPRLALRKSLARLSVRPRSIIVLSAVPVLAITAGIIGWLLDWRLGVDSAVYRAGALTLLHGDPLYDSSTLAPEPWWALLPFTYPPTAALLFVPLAAVPTQVAWGVLTAISVLAMALVIRVTIGSLPKPVDDSRWWSSPARATLVFSVVMLGLEPVWRTVFLGQINLILMALVVVDVLVISARDSRAGGILVGVAAAVKLTPLIFVVHLFLTGKRKAAARALATFAGLEGLMLLLIPSDTIRYWTKTVSDTGRIGPVHWAGNQSLNGLMNRVTDLAPWASKAAIGVSALLAIPAVWLMLRFHRRGQALAALLVSAFFALLASPISWSHHWVWAVPLIVLLIARLPRTRAGDAWRRWVGTGAVIAVFISCVLLVLPNGRNIELHWKFWQGVLGNAYILMPLVLAAVLVTRWMLRRRRRIREAAPS
ncbi:glycosyltransferase 87 family protein [Amycolatopsis cynarae]|uniref:Glycosyltransferase 87 family protein n=1 Tax=Amycolatopsis cynarae TaxID=2995223 RepID=A0ABY7B0Z9_9PSEU|nr:glycosyltransferase 87 family protein [Amycolatopsis sp. HUAS 11-8]WAL64933.1 glycosyltransferase 87 family protein [Amycolatopsis sp. HUAS 11-8]